ncbi:hypothetical protein [Amycolatopsis sp. WAC 01376]|uniref:hypothetical protein n=1 Tax=Amycolatopsis sp. WAC 01376 TaxID=2203195 RepID=UPI000F76AB5F|nr:hypothetical protein [Amycolatopsis sp. WAC 01376]
MPEFGNGLAWDPERPLVIEVDAPVPLPEFGNDCPQDPGDDPVSRDRSRLSGAVTAKRQRLLA